MRELSSTAIAAWLLLMAGGCRNPHVYTDVSGDPRYNPGGIVGRWFYLREGAYLLVAENQRPKQNPYERLAAADERFYPAMSAFESGTWDRSRYRSAREIIAVVPAGTMVCVRKIVRDESLKDKPLRPVAAIIDKHFMSQVLLSATLVQEPDRLAHWAAVESFLAPCDKATEATRPATKQPD